jgi:hypothetical protein
MKWQPALTESIPESGHNEPCSGSWLGNQSLDSPQGAFSGEEHRGPASECWYLYRG